MHEAKHPDEWIDAMHKILTGCWVSAGVFALLSIVYACLFCRNYKEFEFAIYVANASGGFLSHNRRIYFTAFLFNALTLSLTYFWIVFCY
jgi:hypothetical protein